MADLQLSKLLSQVYDKIDAVFLEEQIEKLWDQYGLIAHQAKKVSHKDVALITYGDQVQGPGNHLQELHRFLDRFCRDLISVVHILPFYPYTSDDGFSVLDYYKIRRDLGDWKDLQSIAGSNRLMFDAVINHMSSESEWFQGYLNDQNRYANFFVDGSRFKSLDQVVRPRTSPLIHDFNGKYVWTTFSRDQVDLNYENPRLFLQILDVLCFYVEKGASLIRLDAIGFMWKEDGTSCIHLPQAHTLIKVIRKVLEMINPEIILITETNVPHKENISYFGDGDEAHMVYNFTLPPLLAYTVLTGKIDPLIYWLQGLEFPGNGCCFFNFLASHDGVGLRPVDGILEPSEINVLVEAVECNGGKVSYRSVGNKQKPYELNCNYLSLMHGKEQDEDLAIKRFLLAHAFLLTIPGLPAIYYHSLVGSKNDLQGLKRLGYNRAVNREKHQYEEIARKLENTSTPEYHVFNALREMIGIRQQRVAFDPYGNCKVNKVDDQVICITRGSGADEVLAYFNFGRNPIELAQKKDLLNISTGLKSSKIELEGYGFGWYS